MEAQYKARKSAEDTANILRDLQKWTEQARKMDREMMGDAQTEPRSSSAGNQGRGERSDKPAAKRKPGLPGDHFRRWEQFDVEAALAETSDVESDDSAHELTRPATPPAPPSKQSSPLQPQATASPKPRAEKSGFSFDRRRTTAGSAAPDLNAGKPSARRKTAEQSRQEGNEAFKQGNLEAAFAAYTKSIKAEKTAAAYANRAMVAIKQGRFSEGESDSTSAIELDHKFLKAWQRRATCRRQMGNLLDAAQDLEEALRLEPNSKTLKMERDACLDVLASQGFQAKPFRIPVGGTSLGGSSTSNGESANSQTRTGALASSRHESNGESRATPRTQLDDLSARLQNGATIIEEIDEVPQPVIPVSRKLAATSLDSRRSTVPSDNHAVQRPANHSKPKESPGNSAEATEADKGIHPAGSLAEQPSNSAAASPVRDQVNPGLDQRRQPGATESAIQEAGEARARAETAPHRAAGKSFTAVQSSDKPGGPDGARQPITNPALDTDSIQSTKLPSAVQELASASPCTTNGVPGSDHHKADGVQQESEGASRPASGLESEGNGLNQSPQPSAQGNGKSQTQLNEAIVQQLAAAGIQSTSWRQPPPNSAAENRQNGAAQFSPPKTGTEFETTWRKISGDPPTMTAYLQSLSPKSLPSILKSTLTGALLSSLLSILLGPMLQISKSEGRQQAIELLHVLPKVPRFTIAKLSWSKLERQSLSEHWFGAQTHFDGALRPSFLELAALYGLSHQ